MLCAGFKPVYDALAESSVHGNTLSCSLRDLLRHAWCRKRHGRCEGFKCIKRMGCEGFTCVQAFKTLDESSRGSRSVHAWLHLLLLSLGHDT